LKLLHRGGELSDYRRALRGAFRHFGQRSLHLLSVPYLMLRDKQRPLIHVELAKQWMGALYRREVDARIFSQQLLQARSRFLE
jgi:hypothetical protein